MQRDGSSKGGSSSRKMGTTVYPPSTAKGASKGFGTKLVIPYGGALGITKCAIILILSTDTVYIFLHKTKQCNCYVILSRLVLFSRKLRINKR